MRLAFVLMTMAALGACAGFAQDLEGGIRTTEKELKGGPRREASVPTDAGVLPTLPPPPAPSPAPPPGDGGELSL